MEPCKVGVVPCLDYAVLLGKACAVLLQLLKQARPSVHQTGLPGLQAEDHWEDLPLGPAELALLMQNNSWLKHALAAAQTNNTAATGNLTFSVKQGVLHLWEQGRSQLVVLAPLRGP